MQYIDTPEPQWAKECKRWIIDLCLMYTGLPLTAKILDLGSGIGQFMRAWQSRGFKDVHGIEISRVATSHSCMPTLHPGSAQNMPFFGDKEFDLVFSSAFFEHIDESILDDVLDECFRVGTMQAHTLCLQQGTDPSHINMKNEQEWLDRFEAHATDKDLLFIVPDDFTLNSPYLMAIPNDKVIHPVRERFVRDATRNDHKQH